MYGREIEGMEILPMPYQLQKYSGTMKKYIVEAALSLHRQGIFIDLVDSIPILDIPDMPLLLSSYQEVVEPIVEYISHELKCSVDSSLSTLQNVSFCLEDPTSIDKADIKGGYIFLHRLYA